MTTNNVAHVLISKKLARTAGVQTTNLTAANYLADGEMVVTDSTGTVIMDTAGGATDVSNFADVRICQNSNGHIFWSQPLKSRELVDYKGSAFSAAVEQQTSVGFNGTGGSIDPLNNSDYIVRVIRYDTQALFLNKEMLKFGAYTSSAAATQGEIATGLHASLLANFAREPQKTIQFDRISDLAMAATGTTGTFVEGSTSVATAAPHGVAVGDTIRVAILATNSDAVYIAAAGTAGAVIILDTPYQGPNAAGVGIDFVAGGLAASNCGVLMTGRPMRYHVGTFKYMKQRWELTIANAGSTDLTFLATADEGTGQWESMQQIEWFSAEGSLGKIERIGTPPPTFKSDVIANTPYSVLYLTSTDKAGVGTIDGPHNSPIQLYMILDKTGGAFNTNVTGAADSLVDVLDAWVAAFNIGTAQAGNI